MTTCVAVICDLKESQNTIVMTFWKELRWMANASPYDLIAIIGSSNGETPIDRCGPKHARAEIFLNKVKLAKNDTTRKKD